jgi:hypothetical protein
LEVKNHTRQQDLLMWDYIDDFQPGIRLSMGSQGLFSLLWWEIDAASTWNKLVARLVNSGASS